MYNIELLQQQLAALQQSVNATTAPQTVKTPFVPTKEEVKALIREVLLEDSRGTQPPPTTLTVTSTIPPEFFPLIGKALKEEDQLFLSKHIDTVKEDLSEFIVTDEGQYAIQEFVSFIRSKYENQA